MTSKISSNLTEQAGLYPIQDAAYYVGTSVRTLRYWFYGDTNHAPVRKASIDGEYQFLNFYDLIEAIAIKELRTQGRFAEKVVSLQRIRAAIDFVRQTWGIEYPFSKRNKVGSDGYNLHIKLDGKNHPVQITGKNKKQQSIEFIGLDYINWIDFDDVTNQARRYIHPEMFNDKRIILNPQKLMGEPFVEDAPISAPTLYRAFLAEGSEKAVSRYFNVDMRVVSASIKYCERLKLAA